jgi:hypothetical protein
MLNDVSAVAGAWYPPRSFLDAQRIRARCDAGDCRNIKSFRATVGRWNNSRISNPKASNEFLTHSKVGRLVEIK